MKNLIEKDQNLEKDLSLKKTKTTMILSICLTILMFLVIATFMLGCYFLMIDNPGTHEKKVALANSIAATFLTIPFGFLLHFTINEIKLYRKIKRINKKQITPKVEKEA